MRCCQRNALSFSSLRWIGESRRWFLGGVLLLALGVFWQGQDALAKNTMRAWNSEFLQWDVVFDTTLDRYTSREKYEVEKSYQGGKLWKGWFKNGKRAYIHRWLRDNKHGRSVDWNDQGQKIHEEHFEKGYRHGRFRVWFSNGKLSSDMRYVKSRLHGPVKIFYWDGKPKLFAHYKRGHREGKFSTWYPDGTLACQAYFRKDKRHGLWKRWNRKGLLIEEKKYVNGKMISLAKGPQPKAGASLLGAEDFSLIFRQGSGMYGFRTLRIAADGRCELLYFYSVARIKYNTFVWRKVSFQLTPQEQSALREELKKAKLSSLQDQYINRGVHDGSQWQFALRRGGKIKKIYCSNLFPEALQRFSQWLRRSVILPHKAEILTASRTKPSPRTEVGWLEKGK